MSAPPQPTDADAGLPRASESTSCDSAAPAPTSDLDGSPPDARPAASIDDDDEFLQHAALRPVATAARARSPSEASSTTGIGDKEEEEEEEEAECSTPVAPECMIRPPTSCPPAPKKPSPALKERRILPHASRRLTLLVTVSAEEMDGLFRPTGRGPRAALPYASAGARKRKRGSGVDNEEEQQPE